MKSAYVLYSYFLGYSRTKLESNQRKLVNNTLPKIFFFMCTCNKFTTLRLGEAMSDYFKNNYGILSNFDSLSIFKKNNNLLKKWISLFVSFRCLLFTREESIDV